MTEGKADKVCYLCGQAMLAGQRTNADHIPPQQTIAPELRQRYPVQLVTRTVHAACNSSYEMDERYFVQSLVPFLKDGGEAAEALYRKTIREFHEGRNRGLVEKVKQQGKDRIGHILLPASRMAYQIEGDRFYRVVEKIVRGLHYVEFDEVLPKDLDVHSWITLPREPSPKAFELLMALDPLPPEKGNHRGVFAYRHLSDNPGWNVWAMLFWDRIIITSVFPRGRPPFGEGATSLGK